MSHTLPGGPGAPPSKDNAKAPAPGKLGSSGAGLKGKANFFQQKIDETKGKTLEEQKTEIQKVGTLVIPSRCPELIRRTRTISALPPIPAHP